MYSQWGAILLVAAVCGAEEEVLQLEVNLTPLLLKAGRYHGYDALPSYFIVGGVVFSNASFPLLQNRALMKSKSVNNEIIQSAIEVKQADCDLPIFGVPLVGAGSGIGGAPVQRVQERPCRDDREPCSTRPVPFDISVHDQYCAT